MASYSAKIPSPKASRPFSATRDGVSALTRLVTDIDPAQSGFLSWDDTVRRLNRLLETIRAGRQACRLLRKQAAEVSVRHKLLEIENSGAHCCALLALHVCRFDGVPSRNTGASFEEIRQITGIQARLASLIQLQQRIVEQLKEMLPHAGDDRLYSDLRYMLELHQKA